MTNVAPGDVSAVQEDTFSAPAMFYYMKEHQYYRSLGIGSASQARCSVTEDNTNFTTINEIWDNGVGGLVKKVHLILLGLDSEKFKTKFKVNYIPHDPKGEKGRYSDKIRVGDVDIAEKDSGTVIDIVRELVNKHLSEAQ